ncbi:MAG: CDP-diacylglycerol--glycerol-3-phosphate 3-phosphatidyltransferase [Elusimicrobia bacterium]|nr:CDP-diacylglycerol--glycerol-3-phosphate 3-phosphatidyltransferase [Elusimicrobiota bacterium]
MTLANKVTILRIAGIPVFMVVLDIESFWGYVSALLIFVFLSFTDTIDGFLARKRKEVTVLGEFLDPLADKLLVASCLIYFVKIEWIKIYWWMIVIIISREFVITGLRVVAARRKISIPALFSGKVKTTVQMVAIIATLLVLIAKEAALKWNFPGGKVSFLWDIPFYLVLFATFATLVSGVNYIKKYFYLFGEEGL